MNYEHIYNLLRFAYSPQVVSRINVILKLRVHLYKISSVVYFFINM